MFNPSRSKIKKQGMGSWRCGEHRIVLALAAVSLFKVWSQPVYADRLTDTAVPAIATATSGEPTPGDTAVVPVAVEATPSDKFVLVSDIDDTIKITNVLDLVDLIYRHWNGSATFAGMSRLYLGLAEKVEKVAYLSGSPESQKSNLVQILFKKDQFPEGELLLSNWWHWKSTNKFKTEQLEKLGLVHQNYILVGDDGEQDPLTLSEFQKRHPTFKTRIYIHQIRFAPLPEGVKGYSIPFEVSLAELEEGTISEDAAIQTGEELLKESSMVRIFPDFKRCPAPATFTLTPGTKGKESKRLTEVASELTMRVKEFCTKRGH